MNDIPPQDPSLAQTPAPTPGQPQVGDPTKKLKRIMIIGGIASLALMVGFYYAGRVAEQSKYDPGEPAYQEIYDAGAKSGTVSGAEAGKEKGLEEGKAEGVEKGRNAGIKQGTQAGFAEGTEQGANAALGGLTGWSTDVPYAVQFGEGPSSNVPYAITTRLLMQPGVYYKICNSGENVCVAQPNNGGGPTGPTP